MPRVLAIRHVLFEDLGTLEACLRKRGFNVGYHDVGTAPLPVDAMRDAELLVVLGGPIGIGDRARYPGIDATAEVLRSRLEAGGPTLGVCLGAQLMAHALGVAVAPMGHKEIGFSPLQLTGAGRASALGAMDADAPVLHWHGDQFAIPEGAELLAGTALCPHQAFSVGRHALALQFHIEADLHRIEQWLIGHAAELAHTGIDPAALRAEAAAHAEAVHAAGAAVFGRWLDGVRG